jgi:hypothetical protein
MKHLFVALTFACMTFAANDNSAITGVSRAQMDGLPTLVMRISDEGSNGLTGAISFYLIRRDEGQSARSSPGDPEPLLDVRFDGKALDFKVSHRRAHGSATANDPPVSFRLKLTGRGEGILIREKDDAGGLQVSRDY